MGTQWGHSGDSGDTVGTKWGHSGDTVGKRWGHSGDILETQWRHSGDTVGTQWGHSLCIQREVDVRLGENWNNSRNSGRRMKGFQRCFRWRSRGAVW